VVSLFTDDANVYEVAKRELVRLGSSSELLCLWAEAAERANERET
jgi:hypothetical protein